MTDAHTSVLNYIIQTKDSLKEFVKSEVKYGERINCTIHFLSILPSLHFKIQVIKSKQIHDICYVLFFSFEIVNTYILLLQFTYIIVVVQLLKLVG